MGGTKAHKTLTLGKGNTSQSKNTCSKFSLIALTRNSIFQRDYRVNSFLMNRFFIHDILIFSPLLVGISLSHSSTTNIFSIPARVFNDQVGGLPNPFLVWNTWWQTGNFCLLTTFNIFLAAFSLMQQQIFDFLSFLKHLLLTLQSQIKLHILLLFNFFSLCNQRSMCRLTLTCYVAFVPGNRWKVKISAYKIRLHLSCGFQWRSPWTLASLGNLGNQQHSERQDCFDPSVGRLHHLFPESHFLWSRVHPIHFSTIAFTCSKANPKTSQKLVG